jgi:hypothetical protein
MDHRQEVGEMTEGRKVWTNAGKDGHGVMVCLECGQECDVLVKDDVAAWECVTFGCKSSSPITRIRGLESAMSYMDNARKIISSVANEVYLFEEDEDREGPEQMLMRLNYAVSNIGLDMLRLKSAIEWMSEVKKDE